MAQIKRTYQSMEEKSKKLRIELNRSITSIENFSNELFCEIFDYLDGCTINMAFSNLNHRFQQLLQSSSLLLKIIPDHSTSDEILMTNYKQIILHNRQQIFSINMYMPLHINEFFLSFSFDSSFIILESVFLNQLEPDVLMSVLSNLSCLPRLFSLSIDVIDELNGLTDIYRIILALPMLKYYKFKTRPIYLPIVLSMASNKQLSTIEYLIINHSYTFNQLSAILSYTPQLRHLSLLYIDDIDVNLGIILPMTLTNLKCIFFHIVLEQIETFVSKINCKLRALTVAFHSKDVTLLDADRWEQILRQYLSHLETFRLQYHGHIEDVYESPVSYEGSNQFSSPFWNERQWILEAKSEGRNITYTVSPSRKRWYDYDTQHNMISSSIELSKSNRFIISFISLPKWYEITIMDITSALIITQFYHLEISEENIFSGLLIQIIASFLELNSLQIITLSLNDPRELSDEEFFLLNSMQHTSKISKVYLGEMIDIEEVYFLMKLCPYMTYFKVGCINDMDVELFVREILNKIKNKRNRYLRLLCFNVPAANDDMVKMLKEMISSEKLLADYTIRHVLENIYVQWK